jgi:hypothetical protein
MRVVQDHVQVEYPPRPTTWDEAIAVGTTFRQSIDSLQWERGWHAQMVHEAFGADSFRAYAGEIGVAYATLSRIRWVASRFTPDHVNRFPGLPFTMYEIVAALMEDDPETALDFLEKAYDTPGLTCEAFAAIVNGTDPGVAIEPFRSEGTFVLQPLTDGSIVIGVRITDEVARWRQRFAEHALRHQPARIAVLQIPV